MSTLLKNEKDEMTICYDFFGKTFSDAVSADAPGTPFAIDGSPAVAINTVIVVSDVNIHIERNNVASTDASPFIPALTPVSVKLFGDDTLSYITATDVEDSGSIWITVT